MSECNFGLNFRDMTLSDVPAIREMLENDPVRTCDRTLCGLYLWGLYYEYKIKLMGQNESYAKSSSSYAKCNSFFFHI